MLHVERSLSSRWGGRGLVAMLALVAATGSHAQQPAAVPVPVGAHGAIGARMHEYLRRSAALGFSGQVLVARHGQILLHQAYGFADRSARVPLTPTTRVGVASMSKQFAAAAVLRLEADGRLSLGDSLGKFFPEVPADKRAITLQQLLTHTAGIQGGTTEDFDMPTLEASIARLFALPLTGPVGGKFRYSSDAYGILAAVVQKVAQQPYERYMQDALFEPAGMRHTGLWPSGRTTSDTVARAYTGWRDRGSPRDWPMDWRVFGSGDLLTTAADLYRWELALRARRVLAPATLAKYLSPQVLVGEDSSDFYGYGLFVSRTKARGKVIEHGGDTEAGYNGAFYRYVDGDAVMIITSNANDFYQRWLRWYVQDDLEAMLFGSDTTKLPPNVRAVAPQALSSLAGDYSLPGGVLHLVSDGANLWAAAEGERLVGLLRPVRAADDPAMFARANERTLALLGKLQALDTTAYYAALGDSGRSVRKEYAAEWNTLISTFGPMHGYEVLGSVRDGGTIVVYARLELRDGDEPMTFRWSQLGAGRLVGTNPHPTAKFPIVLPVGRLPDGALVIHDLWRQQERARLKSLDGGRLRLQIVADSSHRQATITTGPVQRIGVLVQ